MHENLFLHSGMHWKLINFFAFVGLLVFLLKKPLAEFWNIRSQMIRNGIEEGQKKYKEAKAINEKLQARVRELEGEVSRLVKNLEEEGELERKRIIEESETLSARMQQEASRVAQQEIIRAKEILKKEAVELSIKLAEDLVEKNLSANDQQKMAEHYLSELQKESV